MAKDITIRKHPVYVARCAQVLRNRLAIDGGRPYVDERLQRAPNETDVSWLGSADDGVVGRRERACLVNDAGRIAAKINQYLFKSPVTRNGADERWLDNVTGDGKSASQFMEDVSTAITAAGWCWLQCDRNPQEFDEFGNPKPYTLAMRVYNDLLVEDMAAATKSDLVRVSRGGDPNCDGCGAWEGVILSVAGKTEGFPTYDEAKAAGCFHPNCVHTLEPVDETADADEIARQKKHPYDAASAATDPDAVIRRKHEIDEERYRAKGLSKDAAKTAVDRDRLTDAIRNGLVVENAEEIVNGLTDAQVAALCKGGRPPQFAPAKGTKAKPDPERWNRGKRGGVVHAKRDGLNAARLAEICGL